MGKGSKKSYIKFKNLIDKLSSKSDGMYHIISAVYLLVVNPAFQTIVGAIFTVIFVVINFPFNWIEWLCIVLYFGIIVGISFANIHRAERARSISLNDLAVKEHAAVGLRIAEEYYDLQMKNIDASTFYYDVCDKIINSIATMFRGVYGRNNFKFMLFSLVKDENNELFCQMDTYNSQQARSPGYYRKKYYVNDKDKPFFAKVLFNEKEVSDLRDNRGVIVLKNRELIEKYFINAEKSTTKQYIGVIIYMNDKPCMLLQVSTDKTNGFIDEEYWEEAIAKIMIPYTPILQLTYEIAT